MNSGKFNLAKSYSEVLNEFYMNPYSMLKENENTLRGHLLGWVGLLFGCLVDINQLPLINFSHLYYLSIHPNS
jgi:hypothetical protein